MSCALLGISLLDQFAHIFSSLVYILLFLFQFLIHFFLRISNVEPMAYLKTIHYRYESYLSHSDPVVLALNPYFILE